MLGGRPVGHVGQATLTQIWNSEEMQWMRRLHTSGRAGEIDICSRCCTTIPHPALVVASLLLHGRTVRRLLPLVERLAYFSRLGRGWLRPSQPRPTAPVEPQLVRIKGENPLDRASRPGAPSP